MDNTQHSQGDFTVLQKDGVFVLTDGARTVAEVSHQLREGEQLANARIFAAAPALLRVAQDYDESLGELGLHCPCGGADCRTTRLREALAKAIGATHG